MKSTWKVHNPRAPCAVNYVDNALIRSLATITTELRTVPCACMLTVDGKFSPPKKSSHQCVEAMDLALHSKFGIESICLEIWYTDTLTDKLTH